MKENGSFLITLALAIASGLMIGLFAFGATGPRSASAPAVAAASTNGPAPATGSGTPSGAPSPSAADEPASPPAESSYSWGGGSSEGPQMTSDNQAPGNVAM